MIKLIAEEGLEGRHRQRLTHLLKSTSGRIYVASPYVTDRDLLLAKQRREVRLLTSLALLDVVSGAISLEALDALIGAGVECRFVANGPRLHAKVYIFDTSVAVVTSANLTLSALDRNIEVGAELRGESVKELVEWYDRLWKTTRRIDSAVLRDLRNRSSELRREYINLRRKATKSARVISAQSSVDIPSGDVAQLFDTAKRFFVCNSNRRHGERTPSGGFVLEERMRTRGLAVAWTNFKFEAHIQQVEPGDAIFMFAKGIGVIGIGVAKSVCETLAPGHHDRLYDEKSDEWRVSVAWLDWRDEVDACPIGKDARNFTFWNVSDDSYVSLRERIEDHFLGG